MFIIFTVSGVRDPGASLAVWFWLEAFHKVAVNTVAGQEESLLDLEDLCPRHLSHLES